MKLPKSVVLSFHRIGRFFLAMVGGLSVIPVVLSVAEAEAASGSWIATTSGFWDTAANWTGGTVASGPASTATFGVGVPTDITVTLNAARTIGNLTFGNLSKSTAGNIGRSTVGNWSVAGDFSNRLILQGTTPTITVNNLGSNRYAAISSTIDGDTLTKAGIGRLTLSGANIYTGRTTVSEGILNIQHANALGTTAADTIVSAGAALEIQGGITTDAEPLEISGSDSTASSGALRNVAGNNTFTGTISLKNNPRINSDSGTLTLDVASGNAIDSPDVSVTFGGSGNITVCDPMVLWSGELIKDGTGKLTLCGANTYAGSTTIISGVLNIQNEKALGATAGATSVASGAALEIEGAITTAVESLALNGTGIASGGALRNVSGANTFAGYITCLSDTRINSDRGALLISHENGMRVKGKSITFGGAGNITVSNAIDGGAADLSKDGAGMLILGGTNTYTGSTTVSAGTLMVTGSLASNGSDNVFIAKDADGVFGTDDDVRLSRRVTAFGSYAGLGSAVQGAGLGSIADIREGTNTASDAKDVFMQWRGQDPAEPAGHNLVSDVLNLSGMADPGMPTDPFVLEMSYDPTKLRPGQSEEQYRQSGAIYLAWLDGDVWRNAVAGNLAAGSSIFTNYNGAWDVFRASHTNELSNYLGSWGVDTTGQVHKAWAVIDHNSVFAVVPEPDALTLLVYSFLCLLPYVWRSTKA